MASKSMLFSYLTETSQRCTTHRAKFHQNEEDPNPEVCQKVLIKIKDILPQLSAGLLSPDKSTAKEVSVMCNFLDKLGLICPHVAVIFDDGQLDQIGPMLFQLWQLVCLPRMKDLQSLIVQAAKSIVSLKAHKEAYYDTKRRSILESICLDLCGLIENALVVQYLKHYQDGGKIFAFQHSSKLISDSNNQPVPPTHSHIPLSCSSEQSAVQIQVASSELLGHILYLLGPLLPGDGLSSSFFKLWTAQMRANSFNLEVQYQLLVILLPFLSEQKVSRNYTEIVGKFALGLAESIFLTCPSDHAAELVTNMSRAIIDVLHYCLPQTTAQSTKRACCGELHGLLLDALSNAAGALARWEQPSPPAEGAEAEEEDKCWAFRRAVVALAQTMVAGWWRGAGAGGTSGGGGGGGVPLLLPDLLHGISLLPMPDFGAEWLFAVRVYLDEFPFVAKQLVQSYSITGEGPPPPGFEAEKRKLCFDESQRFIDEAGVQAEVISIEPEAGVNVGSGNAYLGPGQHLALTAAQVVICGGLTRVTESEQASAPAISAAVALGTLLAAAAQGTMRSGRGLADAITKLCAAAQEYLKGEGKRDFHCALACAIVLIKHNNDIDLLKSQFGRGTDSGSSRSLQDSSNNVRDLQNNMDIGESSDPSISDWPSSTTQKLQELCLRHCQVGFPSLIKDQSSSPGSLSRMQENDDWDKDVQTLKSFWQQCRTKSVHRALWGAGVSDSCSRVPTTLPPPQLGRATRWLLVCLAYQVPGDGRSAAAEAFRCCVKSSAQGSGARRLAAFLVPNLISSAANSHMQDLEQGNCVAMVEITKDILAEIIHSETNSRTLIQVIASLGDVIAFFQTRRTQGIDSTALSTFATAALALPNKKALRSLLKEVLVLLDDNRPDEVRVEMTKALAQWLEAAVGGNAADEPSSSSDDDGMLLLRFRDLLCDPVDVVRHVAAARAAVLIREPALQALYRAATAAARSQEEGSEGGTPVSAAAAATGLIKWVEARLDEAWAAEPAGDEQVMTLLTALRALGCAADPAQVVGRTIVAFSTIRLLGAYQKDGHLKGYAAEMLISVTQEGRQPFSTFGASEITDDCQGLLEEHGEELYPDLMKVLIEGSSLDIFFEQLLNPQQQTKNVLHHLEAAVPWCLPPWVCAGEEVALAGLGELLARRRAEAEAGAESEAGAAAGQEEGKAVLRAEMQKHQSKVCLHLFMELHDQPEALRRAVDFFHRYLPQRLCDLVNISQKSLVLDAAQKVAATGEGSAKAALVREALKSLAHLWWREQPQVSQGSPGGKRKASGGGSTHKKKRKERGARAQASEPEDAEEEQEEEKERAVRAFVSAQFLYVVFECASKVGSVIDDKAVRTIRFLQTYLDPLSKFAPKLMAFLNTALSSQLPETALEAVKAAGLFAQKATTTTLCEHFGSLIVNLITIATFEEHNETGGTAEREETGVALTASRLNASEAVHTQPVGGSGGGSGEGDLGDAWGGARREAGALLRTLVVRRRAELRGAFGQVPFFPNHPGLEDVKQVLYEELGPQNFAQQLSRLTSLLSLNNLKVCIAALEELGRFLKAHPAELTSLCAGKAAVTSLAPAVTQREEEREEEEDESEADRVAVDPVVEALFEALLRVTACTDNEWILALCGFCLGELGAIDPSRFSTSQLSNPKSDIEAQASAPWNYDPTRMAFHLIDSYLVTCFKDARNAHLQDKIAYAIQELLKILGCAGQDAQQPTSREAQLPDWLRQRFSDNPQTLEIIESHWHTTYLITDKEITPGSGSFLVQAISHQQWLNRWCRHMSAESTGPFKMVFKACQGVMREQQNICLYLLPYLMQNIIGSGDDLKCDILKKEILSVLRSSEGDGAVQPFEPGKDIGCESQGKGGMALKRQAARRTLFGALDTLVSWSSRTKSRADSQFSAYTGPSTGGEEKGTPDSSSPEALRGRLQAFLQEVPKGALAQAAAAIGASARALRYCEAHLRESRAQGPMPEEGHPLPPELQWPWRPTPSEVLPGELGLLRFVHRSLGDPDGMAGVEAIRRASALGPSLDQQVALAEAGGDWAAAHDGYEAALQQCRRQPAQQQGGGERDANAASPGTEVAGDGGVGGVGGDRDSGNEAQQAKLHAGLVRSLIHLGQYESALAQATGAVSQAHKASDETSETYWQLGRELFPYAMEAAWRLERWDAVQSCLEDYEKIFSIEKKCGLSGEEGQLGGGSDSGPDRAQLARLLLALKEGNRPNFHKAAETAAAGLAAGAGAAAAALFHSDSAGPTSGSSGVPLGRSSGVAARLAAACRPQLLQLQRVAEVRCGGVGLVLSRAEEEGDTVEMKRTELHPREWQWGARLALVGPSAQQREVLASTRRAIFQLAGMPDLVWNSWISTAKSCRKAGHFEMASLALHQASGLLSSALSDAAETGQRVPGQASHQAGCSGGGARAAGRAAGCGPRATLLRVQEAKLLWARGLAHQAVDLLEPVKISALELTAEIVKNGTRHVGFTHTDRLQFAKQLVLATSWMQEIGLKHGEEVVARYQLALSLVKWERGYFELAKYYDFLFTRRLEDPEVEKAPGTEDCEKTENLRMHAIQTYLRSLEYGCKKAFSSLPRALTLYFELGELAVAEEDRERGGGGSASARSRKLQSQASGKAAKRYGPRQTGVVAISQKCTKSTIPPRVWYTCLPQLLSRVSHPCNHVVQTLITLLLNITLNHLPQAVWLVAPLATSLNERRRGVGEAIVKRAIKRFRADQREEHAEALEEAMPFFKEMIALAKLVPAQSGLRAVRHRPPREAKARLGRARLVVPVRRALQARLPPAGRYERECAAFPGDALAVREIREDVEVMASKARPKKVTVLTHCGQEVPLLCKREKDGDLRKDSRLMEIGGIVNHLLRKDPEGRRRDMQLRTYSVICLNEECGLLEWVPNTKGIRHVINEAYTYYPDRSNPTIRELKGKYEYVQTAYKNDLAKMASEYQNAFYPMFPPVLHRWFLERFPEPGAWFEARTLFARTAALWSAFGHVVGLGDRHGENVLVDLGSGACLHVDFDCLFDKGLRLAVPEIVPFRLTPQVVDAFGAAKVEGAFRAAMEVALAVLRAHRATLLSVLEGFLQDPTVGWQRLGKAQRPEGGGGGGGRRAAAALAEDTENLEAKQTLATVRGRLAGVYNLGRRARGGAGCTPTQAQTQGGPGGGGGGLREELPLSVQGQARRLIEEATSVENLCQMYIGWMPWS